MPPLKNHCSVVYMMTKSESAVMIQFVHKHQKATIAHIPSLGCMASRHGAYQGSNPLESEFLSGVKFYKPFVTGAAARSAVVAVSGIAS